MARDEYMTGQELGEKLLESIRQMHAGLGTVVYSPIIAARQRAGLSHFAALLGVSLQEVAEAVELKPGQEARQAGRQGNLSAVRCGVFRVLAERPRLPTHPAR